MKVKFSTVITAVLTLSLFFTACAPAQKKNTATDKASGTQGSGISMEDRGGNPITVPKKLKRIITTAPSDTEILVALGLSDKLIAIDTYSADVQGVDAKTPKIDFTNPDAEAIIKLKPDLIVTSGYNLASGEDPFAMIKKAGICVASVPSSNSIQGICDDIRFLAKLTGTEQKGQQIVNDYMSQVNKIKATLKKVKLPKKKKVYFEISPSPDIGSFGSGTFLNEFIETVGAENIYAGQKGWVKADAESILAANPDVILTNAGYVKNAVNEIKSRPGWKSINAVKNNQVYLIDTNASSRPSQLSIKALKQIAKAVYPELYE